MVEKRDLAHIFLQKFVNEIIINNPVKAFEYPNRGIILKTNPINYTKPQEINGKKYAIEMLPPLERPISTIPTNSFYRFPKTTKLTHSMKRNNSFQSQGAKNILSIKSANSKINEFNSTQEQRPSNISKIKFIIRDPAVTEIECQGSDKKLLVRKGGIIQKTKLTLSKDEIINILNDFSIKTKIPIIGGTFKAASENLIITAIISEILGPRFIIQKRNPFQSLLPY